MTFYPDPRRKTTALDGPLRLFSVKRRRGALPEPDIVEREGVHFFDGFVVFANGPQYSEKTEVLAFSWSQDMVVEELTELPREFADPATGQRATRPPTVKVQP